MRAWRLACLTGHRAAVVAPLDAVARQAPRLRSRRSLAPIVPAWIEAPTGGAVTPEGFDVMTAIPQLESVLTCPVCGHVRREVMPTDACLFFYECEQCQTVLRPKPGDCCVFCSYGSVPCPPVQAQRGGTGCCA